MTIHDRIRDGLSLAKVYADDGAFRTAAARLRRLADELDRHAEWADELDKLDADLGHKELEIERREALAGMAACPPIGPDGNYLSPASIGPGVICTVDGVRNADAVIAEMRDRHVETDAERCDRIGAAEYREARGE